MFPIFRLAICLILCALSTTLSAAARATPDDKVLRVCADPNNMPLSDKSGAGYENRIAELVAADLGLKLEYFWMPQRMGFIHNTLNFADEQGRYRCDLVIGVPAGYELAATTRPWLHSSWVMVLADLPELHKVSSLADLENLPKETRAHLRFGAFTHTQALDWLFKHDLFPQTQVYKALSADPDETPGGAVIHDLVAGNTQVGFLWGPIGGYAASRAGKPLRAVALQDPALKFDYLLAFGVRRQDKEWRATLNDLIARRQADIDRILDTYAVPRLPLPPPDERGKP